MDREIIIIITTSLSGLTSLLVAVGSLSASFRKRQPDLVVQIFKKQERLAKLKLNYEACSAKVKLEIDTLKKQAKYQAEKTKFATGIKFEESTNQVSDQSITNSDPESQRSDEEAEITLPKELTEKGEKVIQGVNQVVNSARESVKNFQDQGIKKIGSFLEKFKLTKKK